jgi:hypothetical protein
MFHMIGRQTSSHCLQNSEEEAIELAGAYFEGAAGKKKTMERLSRFGLDEGSVEAEAVRLAGTDLERLDNMLSQAERRRYKTLRFIGKYRQSLALQIRQVTDRMIAAADVPRLELSTLLDHGE